MKGFIGITAGAAILLWAIAGSTKDIPATIHSYDNINTGVTDQDTGINNRRQQPPVKNNKNRQRDTTMMYRDRRTDTSTIPPPPPDSMSDPNWHRKM